MDLDSLPIHDELKKVLAAKGMKELRPSQEKSIEAGLLEGENLLVCTPTASGKTLVAEIASLESILNRVGKAIYLVPLRALASEKHESFQERYGHLCKIGISIGDTDSPEEYLSKYDIIFMTSEKLDSIIRHHARWLAEVKVVVADEIHLLNDPGRGPTLEILITLLKRILKGMQFIGLSATIGNSEELAEWLDARLVKDNWRPVKLYKGVLMDNNVEFYE